MGRRARRRLVGGGGQTVGVRPVLRDADGGPPARDDLVAASRAPGSLAPAVQAASEEAAQVEPSPWPCPPTAAPRAYCVSLAETNVVWNVPNCVCFTPAGAGLEIRAVGSTTAIG